MKTLVCFSASIPRAFLATMLLLAALSLPVVPTVAAADFLENFDGSTLNLEVWERIGEKSITVAGSRLTWADDGGNWADGEISPWRSFYLPSAGQTTTILWQLGPASITVDRGAAEPSMRYQIGIYSANNTATRREHWANTTGGVWCDITGIRSGTPGGVDGELFHANDSKLSDSQGTGLAGVVISDWNWQTESREFRLELTDIGYTWFDGTTQLGTQTWADAGIDTEFGNGYRVMALGMNYDSGRGTSSIERVEVRNPGEPPKLIAAFGPSKGMVTAGQQSSLIWQIDPEASASIDQGIGNVDNRTTDGSGSIFIIPPDVTEPSSIIYTLTVTKGAEEEVREASLSVLPRPELVYDDFVDDFVGTALDPDLWETRGGKTFVVADGRVTWNDDGGNWDHNEVDSKIAFPLPPRGRSTIVRWVLGPGEITTDVGNSIRYQFGLFSYHETAGWSRQTWQNSSGGIWLDIGTINNSNPGGVSGGVLWADDQKPVNSQYDWLAGFTVSDWNWQTDTHEFSVVLTDLGFTWYSGEDQLYQGTWEEVNIDNEFANGFKIMAAGMNYDTGRGFTSLERIQVINGAVREQFSITSIEPVAGGWSFFWESTAGEPATYTVQRLPEVGGAWSTLAENLPAQGTTTSYTDTDAPSTQAFYRVIKSPPPALFQTGFEPGEDLSGWAEVILAGGTQWEVGTPSSGPGSARTGVNVLATKLASDYDENVHVGYRSPVVDLTGVQSAVLQFYHYFDFEFGEGTAFDWGELYVLDAAGQNLLPGSALRFEDASGGWRRVAYELPVEALGKEIRFEFRLYSDLINGRPGWYIDDIRID
jgi:hypothetical protein